MSNETKAGDPFWKGRTPQKLGGIPVKVRFDSGTEVVGVTCYMPVGVRLNGEDVVCPFVFDHGVAYRLKDGVASVEELPKPRMMRIDRLRDVRKGDVVVTKSGNRYKVEDVTVYGYVVDADLDGAYAVTLPFGKADHAERALPTLPTGPGLYRDQTGRIWLHDVHKQSWRIIRAESGAWSDRPSKRRGEIVTDAWLDKPAGVPAEVLPMTPVEVA